MTNTTHTFAMSVRVLAAATLVTAAIAFMALPVFAYAATYAYVNTSGEVRTVTANTANEALATAPSLHIHSGVMLLVNPADSIVGDTVPVN